ncbi:MAG: nucleotidyl transferase AbiEii/AbiGii toxin family protein [Deltaproteobacteria bacterium]|nr:nucleotidyl transferase AbiEii/AbiGii toxin family protein [Deltaproteobacteria bacterium]
MIPQRDISLLSNRLAERGGRRIPETVLERDYCLSWFLVGLSRSPLRDRLAFKEEYRDLPEDAGVRVYSLDEVAVEKTVALLDRARNEPRDLYDLWFLTANGHVRLPDLLDPVARKLEFRELTLAQAGKEFAAKEARYRKLWQVRLGAQMAELPEFNAVYREVRRALRQGGFSRG